MRHDHRVCVNIGRTLESRDTVRSWTRSATPTPPAPASARPSSPAATRELDAFDVVLERVSRGRPERSLVLTGLRGVGKTVLLNALRSAAVRRGLGHRQARGPARRAVAASAGRRRCTWRSASSRPATPARRRTCSAWSSRSRSARVGGRPASGARSCATAGSRASTCRPSPGRADSGDIEIDLVELLTDVAGLGRRRGPGHRDLHRRDAGPGAGRRLRALRRLPRAQPAEPAARSSSAPACRTCPPCCRRRSRTPRGCSATRASTASTGTAPTGRCARRRRTRARSSPTTRWTRCTRRPPATRTSCRPTARSRGTSRRRRPITADDVAVAAPEAEAELAVGFFGSRYERATPAEREYLRAMADLGVDLATRRSRRRRPRWRSALGRKPQSLSPARDALIKKGLVYSRRARPDRVHRAALRALPALVGPRLTRRGSRRSPPRGRAGSAWHRCRLRSP